jgi:hypothetical protein
MEGLLSRASHELAIRSEVETTLTSILQDIEHAAHLTQTLQSQIELQQYQARLEALQAKYNDREVAWHEEKKERQRLGNLLLGQILDLSANVVKKDEDGREREVTICNLQEEKNRLLMAATAAAASVDVNYQGKTSITAATSHADVLAEAEDLLSQSMASKSSENPTPEKKLSHSTTTVDGVVTDVNNNTDHAEKEGRPEILSVDDTTARITTTPAIKVVQGGNVASLNAAAAPGGTTIAVVEERTKFVPHELNETTLMNIFAYADPMDVMNFAQTNKALLRKVNVMFGMESGEEETTRKEENIVHDDTTLPLERNYSEEVSRIAKEQIITDQMQTTATVSSMATINTSPMRPPRSATAAATATTPSSSAKSSPKLTSTSDPPQPLPQHKRTGSSTSVSTVGSGGNPFSQLSSWFPTTVSTASSATLSTAVSTPTANASAVVSTTSPPPTTENEPKLNAAMANSMASKLTPAELSIILRMRERLQKCEADAIKWRMEKEDAMANLASVEAVKEFLVTRTRDTERLVQSQKDEMKDIQKKNLEDQEVIVYLDERVKELEKTVQEMKANEAMIKQNAMEVVTKNEKKSRVLSDMLRFEREQIASNEKEWKSTKKLLVKEVRSCRARIVALEAEIEGCLQQNEHLKRGLMALQSNSSPGKKGMKSIR